MTRRSGSPPPSLRAHQLIGSILGSLRPPTEHQPPQPDTLLTPRDSNDVPELLKPSQTDAQLGQLLASLKQHHDSAQLLARELPLLAETARNLAALKAQADGLRPLLASLDQLYASLAATDLSWMPDLVARESAYRHSRHTHYQQLQTSMDEQYADLRRQTVATRAANAERLFQRDLEAYHQRQPSPLRAQRAAQSGTRCLDEVVLAPNAWARGDDAASGFFSDGDDDDGGALSKASLRPHRHASKESVGAAAKDRKDDNGSDTPPGFTVLGDDDYI
ncbi:hypothetical protein IWW37_001239 [Coemansia sp. RSA 2050]|nr:hypothetical protein IWW37_001239 [Coemansia sp. RSA 2050]